MKYSDYCDFDTQVPVPQHLEPFSIYVHLPWCVRKCPYCDFNSHQKPQKWREADYLRALQLDAEQAADDWAGRTVTTVYLGGGTPSLFSPSSIRSILEHLKKFYVFSDSAEVSMEINPGTLERGSFDGYRQAGVTRVSLGVQSFNQRHLEKLGRIHGPQEAHNAIIAAQMAGFNAVNIDLMYALPTQNLAEMLQDLCCAIAYQTSHLSWYQLTLEPNTFFARQPPVLPYDDLIVAMDIVGQELLAQSGFNRYEISAYAKSGYECRHNLNYWRFGDYLGLGAGAHSKQSTFHEVLRMRRYATPTHYMDYPVKIQESNTVSPADQIFEFALNAFRLTEGFSWALLEQKTALSRLDFQKKMAHFHQTGCLEWNEWGTKPTRIGLPWVNDMIQVFLPS